MTGPDASAALAAAVAPPLAALGIPTVVGTVSCDAAWADVLAEHQVRHIAAQHAGGAAALATAYARAGGRLTAVLLGPDDALADALAGISDAARTRTALLVLKVRACPDTDTLAWAEAELLEAAGALVQDLAQASHAPTLLAEAAQVARKHGRPVVILMRAPQRADDHPDQDTDSRLDRLPLDLLTEPVADPAAVQDLARLLTEAHRPVFIAGRGARAGAATLQTLADQAGALLATTVAAHGMFEGNPWHVGVAGVLATPDMAALISGADVVIGWGCSLNEWTTRHGTLIAPNARLAQVDIDPAALGAHRPIDLGVAGDVGRTADAVRQIVAPQSGYRSEVVRQRIAEQASWHNIGYQPMLEVDDRIDPRTLSVVLDTVLPEDRTLIVACDTVLGYPVSYLRVCDADGFMLSPAPHLALASGIGAALARADRLAVATLGRRGILAAAAELETAARQHARLLIVVYDDDQQTSPPGPDITQMAAAYGCLSAEIRRPADLSLLSEWLRQPFAGPLLLRARIHRQAWWRDNAVAPTASWGQR